MIIFTSESMTLDVSSLLMLAGDAAERPKNGLPSSSPNFNGPRTSDRPHLVTILVAIFVATSISFDAPVVIPFGPLMISSAILPP